jgi:hypothetical protein
MHLDERAVVRVTKGHPADAEGDSPTIAVLDGARFRGDFDVDWDSFVSGESEHCVCSGYFEVGHVGAGRHDLPSGAEFWVNPGRTHYIIFREDVADLEARKIAAVKEAEALWARPLDHDEWESGGPFGWASCLSVWTKRNERHSDGGTGEGAPRSWWERMKERHLDGLDILSAEPLPKK